MIRFLINHPVSVIVVFIALLILSIISVQLIPISILPNIDIPEITIVAEKENYSAKEVENKILFFLRQKVRQIGGIEKMESIASQESGVIYLRLEYGRDIDLAFLEINEKIDQCLSELPKDVMRPRAIKTNASEIPSFQVSISYKNKAEGKFQELSDFAEYVLRRQFEQLESVAIVDVSGTSDQEIIIELNNSKLKHLGIYQENIQEALELNNLVLGTVLVKERDYQYLVRLGQPLTSLEEIKNTALYISNRKLLIKDIAKVYRKEKTPNGIFIANKKRAINLAIVKDSKSQVKKLSQDVEKLIENIKEDFKYINFFISRDQTQLLRNSIQNLQKSLIIGALLAVIVVFLFYNNWITPLIIGLIIPISLTISLFFFFLFGVSINTISVLTPIHRTT